MEALRKIIDAETLSTVLDMLGSMRHGQVEIIIFPFSGTSPDKTFETKKSSAFPNLNLDMTGFTFNREEANER